MSERDEAVIEVIKKLTGRAGVRWFAISMDQAQSILKDHYNEAFMATMLMPDSNMPGVFVIASEVPAVRTNGFALLGLCRKCEFSQSWSGESE